MPPIRWAMSLCALTLTTTAASAHPFTVEDLLRLETPGQVNIDPTGRWLIHDTQGPYWTAPRFDDDSNMRPLHSHLLRVDLQHPAAATPAFRQDPRGSYLPGPFSPDGRYLAVLRNLNRRWDLGVLTLAARKVRWMGFGVPFADKGATLAWRSPTHLVALRMTPAERYWKEELQQAAMQQLPGLWARAVKGDQVTARTIGSGRYQNEHVPDPQRQVVDIDVQSGRTVAYAKGAFDSLAISSGGEHLALIQITGRVRLEGRQLIGGASELRRARLEVLDFKTGVMADPCGLEPLNTSLRWSPASEDLLVYVRPSDSDDWAKGGYRRVSAHGACTTLPTAGLEAPVTIDADSGAAKAHADWLADVPVVRAKRAGSDRLDWFSLAGAVPVNLTAGLSAPPADPILIGQRHLMFRQDKAILAVDAEGRTTSTAATDITRILSPYLTYASAEIPLDGAPHRTELFAIGQSDTTTLWRLSEDQATPVVTNLTRAQTGYAGADAGLLTLTTDIKGVATLSLNPPSGPPTILSIANRQLAEVETPSPIAIAHTGPDGQPLKSWLYMPKGAASGRRPPLLVWAYPGYMPDPPPYGVPGAFISVNLAPLLAVGHGYAVLIPNLPRAKDSVSPALRWSAQIDTVLDSVAKTHLVDLDRMAFWGHSYGGYAALMLATETNRFKAIVAAAPVADVAAMRYADSAAIWLTPSDQEGAAELAGWTELGQGRLMATPWGDPERYTANSPIYRADRIHTPILLLQGDQDVMGIGQSRNMFSTLYRLGKDCEFVTFYGEGHNIAGPANMRAYLHTVFDFLDTHLLGPDGVGTTPGASSISAPSVAPTPRSPQ